MPAYIEDVRAELQRHHFEQSAALVALIDLDDHGADFKVAAKTNLVNKTRAALNALDCAVCAQLATDFTGDRAP